MNREKLMKRLKEIEEDIEDYEYLLKKYRFGKWRTRFKIDELLKERERVLKKLKGVGNV